MKTRTVWFAAGRPRAEVIALVARREDEGWLVRSITPLAHQVANVTSHDLVVVFEVPEDPLFAAQREAR